MAKSIAQRSIELAEENAALLAKVAGLDAASTAMTAQLAELNAQIADLSAKLTAAEAVAVELATVKEQAAALDVERNELLAKVEQLSKTLALNPQVKQPDGQDPVASGDGSDGAAGDPATWEQAMQLCGKNYVAARKKFPKVFDRMIEQARLTNKGE